MEDGKYNDRWALTGPVLAQAGEHEPGTNQATNSGEGPQQGMGAARQRACDKHVEAADMQ